MKKYQVELAVCMEDGTWQLENVKVTFPDMLVAPSEGRIWEVANEVFMEWAEGHWTGPVIACTALYHWVNEEEDNP